MDYPKLKEKVKEAEFENKNDSEVANVLNTKNIAIVGKAPLWQVEQLALETGAWIALETACSSDNEQLKAVAKSAMTLITSPRFDNIDMSNDAAKTMTAVLVAAGVLTQDFMDQVNTMATLYVSWSDQNDWAEGVGPGHVQSARYMNSEENQ